MNYNRVNKKVGQSKLAKILGWFFLISGILVFAVLMISYINWKVEEINYTKEYVYSDRGSLYYENNEDIIYVDKIYDTSHELLDLNIPDKETALMYCKKNNSTECIYFDTNNTIDQSILNPILGIITSLFLVAVGVFFTTKRRKNALSSIYLLYVFFFATGISLLGWQLYNAINYFSLKNANYVTTATIYSEIYNINPNELYKPVAYYYVDGTKYIYVGDQYENGTLRENLGTTLELYYKKENPSKVAKKKNPVNFLLLFIGICFTAFFSPFVFFKRKMEKRMPKN